MSTSGWDCHWKEWPCNTPIPAAPCSCPGAILHSSHRSILCGPPSPGLRHKPGWELPLQTTPADWVDIQLAVLVQSRTWPEKRRRNQGEKWRMWYTCFSLSKSSQETAAANIGFCFTHAQGLNCFIIDFFIIRYFYLLLRKLRDIWHFHSYLLWSNNISTIQNAILHLKTR